MEKLLETYRIQQLVIHPGLTVLENTPLDEAVEMMRQKKTGCLLSTDLQGEIKGIFTERDLLNKIMGELVSWKTPIQNFVTPNPFTLTPDETVMTAFNLMRKKNIRRIPILEKNGKLRGVLSIRDLIRLLAEHFPSDIMNLPPRPHNHPTTPEGG